MSLLDKIIALDKAVFIYLNNLGSPAWDHFWIAITHQFNWIPFFLLMLFLIFKAYGLKKGLIILLMAAVLIAFTDQFVNLIKYTFGRIRPNNDPSVQNLIRILQHPHGFSFVSGHATNSMANTVFIYMLLKRHFKYVWLFFIWPLIFAYSRIYVGVHYPIDIFTGACLGFLIGWSYYKLGLFILNKVTVTK